MNFIMRNIFLSTLLTCISVLIPLFPLKADFLGHKVIEHEKLHLYQILVEIKAVLLSDAIRDYQSSESEGSQTTVSAHDFISIKSPLKIIDSALQDIRDIVTSLNNEVLASSFEIEYMFINMCNFLQDKKIIPQSLRELKREIDRFDFSINEFRTKKRYYLKPDAIELLIKMTHFNRLLVQHVLNDDYFDLSMKDVALDLVYHRPLEFISRHKMAFCLGTLAVCGIIAGVYGYPAYISYQLANRNPNYPEMRQLHGFTQPVRSADCGYYAAVHTLLMMNAGLNADPAVMQEHLNRITSINGVVAQLKTINDGADWIDGNQVLNILNQNAIQHCAVAFQAIGLLPQNLDFQDIHMIENAGLLLRGQGIQQGLIDAINRFRTLNRPQGIVLLLAGNRAGQHGHWVSLRLQRNAEGVLQPILVNSKLSNITDYQIVNQVIQLFAHQPIQSQYGLVNITLPLDDAGGVLDNDAHNGTEAARYQSATRHLARAIERIQAADEGQRAQELAFYRDRMTALFTRIRTDALRLDIHQVIIDHRHQIDFDLVQNLDQFIETILGHPIE